jgi:hypothetical protein|tara:strand:+ start:14822 stop:15034 length:213 start_codon:yes stop_codon:yes gene_type:complete
MNKTKIISTSDRIYFQLCQSILSMGGIQFQVNSTMDSMYNAFGSFEIYVLEEDKDKAIELLERNEDTSDS